MSAAVEMPVHMSASQFAALDPQWLAQQLAGEPQRAAALILAAAQIGVPEAQALYGQILLDARGVARDCEQARNWFQKAAHADHAMAMNMLGRCHELGWGGAIDLLIAAYWYQQAAARGLDWGMYNYANLLAADGCVLCDRTQALAWYRKAAAQGHAKSINLVGRFYEEGWVVEKDMNTAFELYHQSALAGDFRGQYNCGRLLADRGRVEEATIWMRRALETATPGFKCKMGHALMDSPQATFREIAAQALRQGSAKGATENYADAVPIRS